MLWVLAGAVAAAAFTVVYLIANAVLEDVTGLEFATTYSAVAALLVAPALPVLVATRPVPTPPTALAALLVSGAANAAAIVASNRAIRLGEVSTVTPLVKTQPAFAVLVGAAALGESLAPAKVAGVALVTVGAYVVLSRPDTALTDPVRRLRSERAPRLAVLAGFLFAVAAVADRFALAAVPAVVYAAALLVLVAVGLVATVAATDWTAATELRAGFARHRGAYLAVAASIVLAYYAVVFALSLAEASRVVPVLQLQVLLTVVGGVLLFDERGARRKLTGSVLLVGGVLLVVAGSGVLAVLVGAV